MKNKKRRKYANKMKSAPCPIPEPEFQVVVEELSISARKIMRENNLELETVVNMIIYLLKHKVGQNINQNLDVVELKLAKIREHLRVALQQ